MEKDVNQSAANVIQELTAKIHQDSVNWLQHVLLLASTLFGIIIALHNNSLEPQYIRLAFALAVFLLGIGILSLSISLYGRLDVLLRVRKAYAMKAQLQAKTGASIGHVSMGAKKIFGICETIGYICLICSVLILSCYTVLLSI
jgi:hypothetical protein